MTTVFDDGSIDGRKTPADPSPKAPTLATSRQAAFLFLRCPEQLRSEEQETLVKLRQIDPEVDRASELVQQFAHPARAAARETISMLG